MHLKSGYYVIGFLLFYLSLGNTPVRAQDTKWVAPAWADTMRNTAVISPENVTAAHGIYSRICAQCHGYKGKGDGPVAGTLPIKPANHSSEAVQRQSDGALFWKISEGRGVMAPYKYNLTTDQRWMLVHYIRTLKAI